MPEHGLGTHVCAGTKNGHFWCAGTRFWALLGVPAHIFGHFWVCRHKSAGTPLILLSTLIHSHLHRSIYSHLHPNTPIYTIHAVSTQHWSRVGYNTPWQYPKLQYSRVHFFAVYFKVQSTRVLVVLNVLSVKYKSKLTRFGR